MGDFVEESLDPANILSAVFVIGSTALAGPAGFLASSAAVLGVSQQVKAAGAQQVELDVAADRERMAALDREVARKRRLVAIVGTQRAAAASAGLALSGSVANVSVSDAEQASIDRLVDRSNTRVTLDSLRRRSRNVGRAGVMSAAGTILTTGATLASGVTLNKPKTTTQGLAPGARVGPP